MDELEAIKQRKLMQLQQQYAARQEMQNQLQVQQVLKEIDKIIQKLLTEEAQGRLANLKLIKPELVQKLKIYLAQLYAAGQVTQIDDEHLRQILLKLQGQKKDFTIKRV
jgi:programmed cell death protein 5